jgi:cell division protein FtsQ
MLFAAGALALLAMPFLAPFVFRRMPFFHVRRIEILGARYVAPSDILARLHVDTTASVWDAIAPLVGRVEAHPEVRSAVVRRKLPGTLVVEIVERVPVALVATPDGLRPYDERGVALPIDPARVRIDAPVLVQRDTGLIRFLAGLRAGMPGLYDKVSAVRRNANGELRIELKTVPVLVMQDVTLERLGEIEPVEMDLARRQVRVTEIDLRYRDQVIARLQ